MDAEKSRPSASIATYAARFCAYDLIDQLDRFVDHAGDARGQLLALARERKRVRKAKGLADDF